MKTALQKDYLDPAAKGVIITPRRTPNPVTQQGTLKGPLSQIPHLLGSHRYQTWNEQSERYEDLSIDQLLRHRRQFVATSKKIVRVNNGIIITPIEIAIKDLRLMRIRCNFFIQLQPIDERLLFVANNFDRKFSAEFYERAEQDLEEILARVRTEEGAEQADGLLQYLQGQSSELDNVQNLRLLLRGDEEAQQEYKLLVEGAQERLENLIFRLQEEAISTQSRMARQLPNQNERVELSNSEAMRYRNIDLPDFVEDILKTNEIYEETARDLQKTDFTVLPTPPLLNLDSLVEPPHISGLAAKTFVGPLTFLLNYNASDLRDTSNLAESKCHSYDCDELKYFGLTAAGRLYRATEEGRKESSAKFHGSIKHMTNMSVDTLIETQRKLDTRYQRDHHVHSQTINFVNLHGLEYVSLTDQDLKSVDPECESIYSGYFLDNCYTTDNKRRILSEDFIGHFNKVNFLDIGGPLIKEKIDANAIEEIIETGQLTPGQIATFCHLMIEKAFENQDRKWYDSFNGAFFGSTYTPYGRLKEACTENASNNSERGSLLVERKYLISKIGDHHYLGGKQMNVNVGSNISMQRAHSYGETYGINFLYLSQFLVGRFLHDQMGAIRAVREFGSRRDHTEGTSIGKQTFLVMQMGTFDIELKEYEKCAVVRWDPRIFVPTLHDLVGDKAFDFNYPGGYFLCTGRIEKAKPVAVRENFYYFTQHFTDGDMLDEGNIYNHPWLLSLRGVQEVSFFLSQLEKDNFVLVNLGDRVINHFAWPINRLVEVYMKTLPTFPKMYSLIDDGSVSTEETSYPHRNTSNTSLLDWSGIDDIDDPDNLEVTNSLYTALPGISEAIPIKEANEDLHPIINQLNKLDQGYQELVERYRERSSQILFDKKPEEDQ